MRRTPPSVRQGCGDGGRVGDVVQGVRWSPVDCSRCQPGRRERVPAGEPCQPFSTTRRAPRRCSVRSLPELPSKNPSDSLPSLTNDDRDQILDQAIGNAWPGTSCPLASVALSAISAASCPGVAVVTRRPATPAGFRSAEPAAAADTCAGSRPPPVLARSCRYRPTGRSVGPNRHGASARTTSMPPIRSPRGAGSARPTSRVP